MPDYTGPNIYMNISYSYISMTMPFIMMTLQQQWQDLPVFYHYHNSSKHYASRSHTRPVEMGHSKLMQSQKECHTHANAVWMATSILDANVRREDAVTTCRFIARQVLTLLVGRPMRFQLCRFIHNTPLFRPMQVFWPVRLIQRCNLCIDFSGKQAHFMAMRLILRSDL